MTIENRIEFGITQVAQLDGLVLLQAYVREPTPPKIIDFQQRL